LFPIVQSALHPSPSIVFASSHCYAPARISSPQTVLHTPVIRLYPIVQFKHVEVETGQDIQLGSTHGTISQRLVTELYIYPRAHTLQVVPVISH
jgi:hypothetical protein